MNPRNIGWYVAGSTLVVLLLCMVPGGVGEKPFIDAFMYAVIPFWPIWHCLVGGGDVGLLYAFGQFPLYGVVLALESGWRHKKPLARALLGVHLLAIIIAAYLKWRLTNA
ncbi:MAG: hypothetical protein K0Q55_673 [Verrucomicrobia bacterium]|nr:hypothetical protein [Verrucomicrobiota bacterium]